ncbi:ABC transporter permease [Serratia sp. DD3]|uniref:ABC transporter permease n=1 Tax=Serratia sp. DD3 TaxID=1410619 RepID=UPI0004190B79|nr:ABC transporter permease [Serratia sp. DD3]
MPVSVRCAVGVLCLLLAAALLADLLTQHTPEGTNLMARLKPPFPLPGSSFSHLLGTDELGRDLLSRVLHGMRISFLIACAGTIAGMVLGVFLGFLAAQRRGWVDDVVLMLIDFNASLPFIIIALAILAFFGSGMTIIISIMAIYGWDRYARLSRNLARAALTEGYASALQALGAGAPRIYLRHILPNIAGVLIVNMTLNFPGTILLETSLSFLGVGVQPPMTSLGMLLGFGRDYLTTAWWIAVIPGTIIVVATLSISVLGDFVQNQLDGVIQRS